jgi:F-type H+-transporting ATPase subunit b
MLAEILHKIGFDWRVALSHTVNIAIIFFLLVKFALPKLQKVIDERTEKIKQGLRNKEESELVLASAQKEAGEITKSAQADKVQVLNSAKEEAYRFVQAGKSQADEIISSARKEMSSAKEDGYQAGVSAFENKVGDLLKIISQKAFQNQVTPEVESTFIKQTFKNAYEK